jgi:hypothetical protein
MELGEPVTVGMVDDHDAECPFSHEKPVKVKNDLGNSSSKLGTRVTNGWSTQLWIMEDGKVKPKENQKLVPPTPDSDCPGPPVTMGDETYPYSISAHHLVPADAALPKSDLIQYIKAGDKIWGDIGYDVNGAENGLWLPTHAALSAQMKKGRVLPGQVFGMKYSELTARVEANEEENSLFATFQQRYTYQVMERTGRQFHDAHPDYSSFVIEVLNKIHLSLATVSSACPKCKEILEQNGKLRPPHTLVFRLNKVSDRLRGFLSGPPYGWRRPVFTSRFATDLAADARVWKTMGLYDR